MNKLFAILVTLIFSALQGQSIQLSKGNISVTINSVATSKVGVPIILSVRLQNNTDKPIVLGRTNGKMQAHLDYDIRVRDQNGKWLLTRSGKETDKGPNPNRGPWSGLVYPLEPGATLDDEGDLTQLFNLEKRGTYTVEVSRPLFPYMSEKIVYSNVISFKVE